jgi:CRP-like cAMP-binding protein
VADYLIHFANVLFVASYSVRDILWLRVLTIVATVSLLPYYYTRPTPLTEAIAWNVLFLAINGWQLWRLVLERRPVRLSLEQQRLYELGFSSLSPREFVKLASIGTWETIAADTTIVENGQALARLTFIVDGSMRVETEGEVRNLLAAGQFVGEVAYVTGKPACASVISTVSCRVIAWEHAPLRAFLAANPNTRASLQNVIGSDLAAKLRAEPPRPTILHPAPA